MNDKMIEELKDAVCKWAKFRTMLPLPEQAVLDMAISDANVILEMPRHEATERGDIDLGLCSVFYSEEDKDYCFNPASGRFPLEKIKGKLGQLIFRPTKEEK